MAPCTLGVADEILANAQAREQISITVYNNNLALIRDQRKINLPKGVTTLAWQEVATQIRPETAHLRSVDAQLPLSVLEQNYHFDLLTRQKLLEKFTGKQVTVIKTNPITGEEQSALAQILSTDNQDVVLRMGDRIETTIPGRIVYPEIPKDIRAQPTLTVMLSNPHAAQRSIVLNYLTGGLSWQANYVGELNALNDHVDLAGWVTLTNQSGAAYQNAQFQLISGAPNQVNISRNRPVMAKYGRAETMVAMADSAPAFAQESLFEYHLYTLERTATLLENQSKQLALFGTAHVPVKKELVLHGYPALHKGVVVPQEEKPTAYLVFINDKEANLGMPLPQGVVRLYTADGQGRAQFIGEDRIAHTAAKAEVRLRLGSVYDVTAQRRRTKFEIIPKHVLSNGAVEAAYDIALQNGKSEPVTLFVKEQIPANGRITEASLPYTMEQAGMAVWEVIIPAEGKTVLHYGLFAPQG
ncbi:DUF4139 domain-containing protein [Magnetococcus marinus]|nr:DUF4139 domain-containing protein [Magnetococcus marinus]